MSFKGQSGPQLPHHLSKDISDSAMRTQPLIVAQPGAIAGTGDVASPASEGRFRALTKLTSDWYWEQDAQFRFIHMGDGLPADSR